MHLFGTFPGRGFGTSLDGRQDCKPCFKAIFGISSFGIPGFGIFVSGRVPVWVFPYLRNPYPRNPSQWGRRDILMSRGKNCREPIFASQVSRTYSHPKAVFNSNRRNPCFRHSAFPPSRNCSRIQAPLSQTPLRLHPTEEKTTNHEHRTHLARELSPCLPSSEFSGKN